MKKWLHDLPLWLINLLTIVSGLITICSPIVTIIITGLSGYKPNVFVNCTIVVLISFSAILILRMRKYRNLANQRMEITSEQFHKLLHETRDLFFDIMHSHKKNTLTISGLSQSYRARLSTILDNLCMVMDSYTTCKVSACVKLITYQQDEEVIDVNNATLVTFCRSNNSDTGRGTYESRTSSEIQLNDNTDFLEILSKENDKDYFYQRDLEQYCRQLRGVGKTYRNTNTHWQEYYKGTIIVPIRIEFKKLYHQKKDEAHHILGFLCVDSLSQNAFTEKQEKYNVRIVNAYADIIYVLLGQYRHYLKKLSNSAK